MTYAAAVMWVWVAALLGTLVAFATAWRGLHRAEGALRELRPGSDVRSEVEAAAAVWPSGARVALGRRPLLGPSPAGGPPRPLR